MARTTPRLTLNVWDLVGDDFDHIELADNWDAIDEQIFVAKGFEIVSSLPNTDNFPGRVVMLSSPSGGFLAWTLCRFEGSTWSSIGAVEVQPTLPSNPYEGRIVILSGVDGGFNAWTMLRYAGAEWRPVADLNLYANDVRIGSRSKLNFVEGDNIGLTLADNNGTESVDITVNADPVAVVVRHNGQLVGARQSINFVEGDDFTFTITDAGGEINITPSVGSPASQPGTALLDMGSRVETVTPTVELGPSGTPAAWVEFDNTNLRLDFTVPASGRVLLVCTGNVAGVKSTWRSLAGTEVPRWGMTNGSGTLITSTDIGLSAASIVSNGTKGITSRELITGLTPGAPLTWYWAGNYTNIYVGRNYGPVLCSVYQVD